MVTINDILNLTTISRRQMNNRLKPLLQKYPNLIIRKGKGGKKNIHPLLIKFLTVPNSGKKITPSKLNILEIRQDTFLTTLPPFDNLETFKSIEWNWFCCFHPIRDMDSAEDLIDTIPLEEGDLCYYSIHRKKDKSKKPRSHIHFVIRTNQTRDQLFKVIPPHCDVDIRGFDPIHVRECYNYLSNPNLIRKDKQELYEWGYLMNISSKKVHLWGRR